MLTNVCIILTIIYHALAYKDKEYTPNVGTVLFSPSDADKEQWTKEDISLLRARRYFQTIIPPLDFINNFNEDYVNILLEYFRNTYSNIKREAVDLETDSIMTTALSDVVGGYLKVWVLPVAKLDYYGGTISQENIVKLYLFYDELKNYLETDGEGWHCPDEDMLNSITINVAPSKLAANTRSIKDPCSQLSYFEKTPTGLGVPLPEVNWNTKSNTMFVPLKNVSLIPMSDPDSANTLVKYYDTAKSCIAETNPKEMENFETKFQQWLSKDIIPHLKDDDIYLALGSVLTLLNKTDDIYNTVLQQTNTGKYYSPSKSFFHIPYDFTSKKVTIIFIVFLLEIAWCIPALVYILCAKKKRDCNSNVYLIIDHGKSDKKDKSYKRNKLIKNVHVDSDLQSFRNVRHMEIQNPSSSACPCVMLTSTSELYEKTEQVVAHTTTQCPSNKIAITMGTGSRSYFSSKHQCCQATDIENIYTPKKSSLKKTKENPQPDTALIASKSQEECHRTEICTESYTVEHARKPSPKNNNRNKESKPVSAPKRHGHNKETKNVLLPKRNDQIKNLKTTMSKHSNSNKDAVNIILAPNNSDYESKAMSLLHKNPSYEPITTPLQNNNHIPELKAASLKIDSSQESKTSSLKQNNLNKHSKSASSSKRSHQRKDLITVSHSATKVSSLVEEDIIHKLEKLPSVNITIPEPSMPDTAKTNEIKELDIEGDIDSSLNATVVTMPTCACTGCYQDKDHSKDDAERKVFSVTKKDTQPHDTNIKEIIIEAPKEQKMLKSKKAKFKVTDSGKSFFEIIIDRPAAEISVDVTSGKQAKMLCTTKKRSKIPKPNVNIQQVLLPKLLSQPVTPRIRPKSMIPQPKKKTIDDIALGQYYSISTRNKLNDTF